MQRETEAGKGDERVQGGGRGISRESVSVKEGRERLKSMLIPLKRVVLSTGVSTYTLTLTRMFAVAAGLSGSNDYSTLRAECIRLWPGQCWVESQCE